jgi:hypothetical protein
MRAIGNRVANRLAEVPQWKDECDSDGTHKVCVAVYVC